MKLTLIILGAIAAVLLFIGISSYGSAVNLGNSEEAGLKAALSNNQNLLSAYTQKVLTIAQVPKMQTDNLVKIVTAAMQGRYGADGSKATWQWIQEQNPNVDQSVYTRLAEVIEAGRDDFKNGQTHLLDLKRIYQTDLGSFYTGWWLHMAGYPKINLDDYKIVTDEHTDETFKTGKEETLKLSN